MFHSHVNWPKTEWEVTVEKDATKGLGYSSVVKCLPSVHQTLGSLRSVEAEEQGEKEEATRD